MGKELISGFGTVLASHKDVLDKAKKKQKIGKKVFKLKPLTDKEKKEECESLREIAECRKSVSILHDLTDEYTNQAIDKLLDVLADIDMIEKQETRRRIKKLCYAIIRMVEKEDYDPR